MSILTQRIPVNWRTLIFCFIMGAALSIPVSFIPSEPVFFEVSPSAMRAYFWVALGSCLILPFWSVTAVRRYPALRKLGLITFLLLLLLEIFVPVTSTA